MSSLQENIPSGRTANEKHYLRLGWIVAGIGFFGLLVWAALAPLDKGVPATGTVIVTGNRKVVQAPVSGMVASIRVKEGDLVEAGDTLIELDRVLAQAKYNRLRTSYISALATEARLLAERDGLVGPVFPPTLSEPEFAAEAEPLMALQRSLFIARTQTLKNEIAANEQTLAGIDAQLRGLSGALAQKRQSSASLARQLSGMRELMEEGFLPRNRWLELERQQSDILSQIEQMSGEAGQARKHKAELQKRIQHLVTSNQQEIQSQLAETQTTLSNYRSELHTAQFELQHTAITAPTAGRVIGITVFNAGNTVTPSDRLMEIVPVNAPLIVDAKLPAHLIDKVHPGLEVNMIFSAFNQNDTPVIPGRVSLVSADRLEDRASGEVWYQIQVEATGKGKALLSHHTIRPGMPVEILIRTGTRSLLNYLFKPVIDRASTALTEE
ncbi:MULTISPECIES: HlyD family type I secretion periplasmic adaptor subunit [Tenebrionibacter/Tenebrionicola group]|jgi:protease secretion system membrane fusion protein|uniref:Membrane fusion protein (MFP) family protein n=2 Tax=Tenebrionibacter/Tenebrionicola group TaxID=2969848 RepID=A0A8K0V853_9ENTR|nr:MULTISPECIES: HlyD family type I secretion periplasmic adaptor subunit [Tenebrionibacter/Tenebrionicola group]MBK4716007.1 HlyD family type I secretion periplasmic adaptor subunit [Tenebrionibacter intestinalis]MBV5096174.1 HlyD family type I secretion periplasmic adaptor subunit [Tenebrionicola larvae]